MADQQGVTRKLAAILYADVAGYSRLTGADEEGTHRIVADYLDAISGLVEGQGGRVVHYAGDAILSDFPSVVTAVKCSIEIQKELAARNADIPDDHKVQFRIGVNLGDVIVDRDDIYGNGVNVAARLESLADPGGICVSGKVYDEVRGKVGVDFKNIGPQQVKNIAQPIQTYRVLFDQIPDIEKHPSGVDKPTIAILPFTNMSSDAEQEYFADGLVEDIITGLSRFRWFFVIARNSSFTYKGRAVDVREIAKDLGSRYVLEGSVRKNPERIRVTAQLIDASTGNHIWAERYDRELQDVFALQDEITGSVVAAIEPALSAVEIERARRNPARNLEVWSVYQLGIWHRLQFTKCDSGKAEQLFRRAIELDPNFASAYAQLADAQVNGVLLGFIDTPNETLAGARRLAQRAIALDVSDPLGYFAYGRVLSLLNEHDLAIPELENAIKLNPSFARAYFGLAHALYASGEVESVIPCIENAIRLSPRDPVMWAFLSVRARAHLSLRQYEEAVNWARKAMQEPKTDLARASFALISALGHLNRIDEAQAVIADVCQGNPTFSISTLTQGTLMHFKLADQRMHILDGLRKAGLPE